MNANKDLSFIQKKIFNLSNEEIRGLSISRHSTDREATIEEA